MSTSLADQTAAFKTQTAADEIVIGAFVRMDLPSYTARFWSGTGDLLWDDGTGSQTWNGVPLGSIDAIPGEAAMKAQEVRLSVSGIDTSAIAALVGSNIARGSDVYIWFFFVSGGTIVSDPWLAFAGKVDTSEFVEDGEGSEFAVTCIDAVGSAFRRTVTRRTDPDQTSTFSGDRFYEFVAVVGRSPVAWGVPWNGGGGNRGGGGGGGNALPGFQKFYD